MRASREGTPSPSTPRRGVGGSAPILLDRGLEGSLGLAALRRRDALAAHAPKLVDRLLAPAGALPRKADRLAGDDHVHRIRVQLREVPQCDPTAAVDRHAKFDVMFAAVCR